MHKKILISAAFGLVERLVTISVKLQTKERQFKKINNILKTSKHTASVSRDFRSINLKLMH